MKKFKDTLFWKNYKSFDKICGNSSMRSTVDGLVYFYLFNEFNFQNILEIGVYQGLTAGLMIESGSNFQSYTGIDLKFNLELFKKLWHSYNTEFIECSSKDFITNKKYDFILIDGCHTQETAYQDLVKFSQNLEINGVLAIDDYKTPALQIAIANFKNQTTMIPFMRAEQTEFWHYPSNNRSTFLDNLLTSKISNFTFIQNLEENNNTILEVKTLTIFTEELDMFDLALSRYNI